MRQLLKSVIITLLLSGPVFGQCVFKQSTASQIHEIGPFVDSTDGVTEKNSLTIAASDVRLEKAGADPVSKNSGGATFKEKGNYYITLDATDTNTVGSLRISINMSGAVYVFEQCRVVTAAVYDAFYGSSALGYVANAPVSVAQFGGSNGTFSGGRPEVITNSFTANSLTRAVFAADTGLQTIRSNTATAGSSTTITLDGSASAVNGYYGNALIYITGGTGIGQARQILSYVGSTKVATVTTWTTTPDNTSTFAILPLDASLLSAGSGPNQINLSAGNVTTGSNLDKTGYALTSPYDAAKTAAQAGDTMKVSNGTGTGQILLSSGQITVATNNDKTGYALTSAAYNAGADALLDRANAIESGETFRQIMRLIASALGGKTTGSGTSTLVFRDINDTKDVIHCSVSSGNRTSCTLDLN